MPEKGLTRATLGLGGNIGDPVQAMASALRSLDARADSWVVAVSRLYRTPPWGKTDQSFFYNSCAAVDTTLEPDKLLDICLGIERDMMRIRVERWGPRTIDIDILTYGDVRQAATSLELPHPRMTERGFVLMPLADIASGMIVGGRKISEWLSDADIKGIEVADANRDWWRNG